MTGILTAALFLFPGSILLTKKSFFPHLVPAEKIPIVVALSLSYWIIGFWWLTILPIPFHTFIFFSLGLFSTILAIGIFRHRAATIDTSALIRNGAIITWFMILAIPGLILINRTIAPSGADMTMHAYLAKIIYLADRFPDTMQPVLPITHFGTYPVGFSVITAAMMYINGLPVYTNALWLSAFTYWFFAVSVYVLIRDRYSFYISAVTTLLISWVSLTPNDFIEWGANPTILSLDFVIIACVFFLHLKKQAFPLFLFICAYAAWLTHYIIPTGLAYVTLFLTPFIWRYISPVITLLKRHASAAYIGVALMIPFVLHMLQVSWTISPLAQAFVSGLQQQELAEWENPANRFPPTQALSFITSVIGSHIMHIYGLSLVLLIVLRKKSVWLFITYALAILLLIINARYWRLPLSEFLYPKRIALLLLLPLALSIAQGTSSTLEAVYTHFVIHSRRNRIILHGLTLIILLYAYYPRVLINIRRFTNSSALNTLTQEDIGAMGWISAHTSDRDIILNNYTDAGLWIPAVTNRQITLYHTNPIDMDALSYNRGKETYAYVGNKSLTAIPQTDEVSISNLDNDPVRYTLVYQNGNARIYKVNAIPKSQR